MEVIKRIIILLLPVLLVSCSEQNDVSLEEFEIEEDVFVSGKALMSLDYGLHPLEEQLENHEILLIGVHGSESRGYEWIYPLQALDTPETLTLFFRWNDARCHCIIFQLLSLYYFSWFACKGEMQCPSKFRENPGAWPARLCHCIITEESSA